jgi:hypothetical protein
MTEDIESYVAEHREDIHYAIKEGDRWVRTVAIAALIAAGDGEVELAKQELKAAQQEENSL